MKARIAAALLVPFFVLGCDREPTALTLRSSTEEPAFQVAAALRSELADRGIQLELVSEFADPDGIVAAVRAGEVDLGIVEEPATRTAGIRTIVPLYPSILHVVHRASNPADSFSELIRGQKVYAGPIGGTAWRLLGQLAQDYGLAPPDYTVLPDPWSDVPDVYFVLGDLLKPAALKQFDGYQFFSFGAADKLGSGTPAEGLALKYPNIRPFILPEAVYGDFNPSPVLTLATRTLLVSGEDLDTDVAYQLARTLIENTHEVALAYHLVTTELNERFDAAQLAWPLHEGARVYLNKDEPSLFERYAEVVGVMLTLLAALTSGLVALLRANRARRKNRIDVYYRRVLTVREQLGEIENSTEYNQLEKKLKALQNEVFELLIAERLNVDESLTLFLNLSNRVLGEIDGKRAAAA